MIFDCIMKLEKNFGLHKTNIIKITETEHNCIFNQDTPMLDALRLDTSQASFG